MDSDRETRQEVNRRIAKNTIILYIRMFVLMIIGFFTTRINLEALGVDNYGIYNVVGGLVGMFSMVSGSLSASISRYITFGLGLNDFEYLKKIFGASMTIQFFMSLIVVILLESIGIWFLNHKLVIPPERLFAAHIVFQFSVVSFAISLLSLPYNACIIAHEKMNAFAFMTLFEAAFKLGIAYAVLYIQSDKLILYAALILSQGLISQLIYWIYCSRKFKECRLSVVKDKALYKEIFSFSGWNYIGANAGLLSGQGVNIVLNMFFGPVVNTARGIGNQINGIIGSFSGNFMTAVNPQITKTYASGDMERNNSLISKSSKLSFFLFFILSLPVFLETPQALLLWLGQIPEYAVGFARLTIVYTWINILSQPLVTALLATGKIRNYQIVVGLTNILNLPLSYLCLKLGAPPVSVVWVSIVICNISLFQRLRFLRKLAGFNVAAFIRDVYVKVIAVIALSIPVPILIYFILPQNILRIVIVALVSILISAFIIYYIGCNRSERQFMITLFQKLRQKVKLAS